MAYVPDRGHIIWIDFYRMQAVSRRVIGRHWCSRPENTIARRRFASFVP
jgi:hypothetical protein